MPDMGGIDISPVVLILICVFIRSRRYSRLADAAVQLTCRDGTILALGARPGGLRLMVRLTPKSGARTGVRVVTTAAGRRRESAGAGGAGER